MAKQASEYRAAANELLVEAQLGNDPNMRAPLYSLVQGYSHLADLVERKATAPIVVPPEIAHDDFDEIKK